MKLHANARTCPKSRRLLVDRLEGGWWLRSAAEAAGVSERTAAKWLGRWRAEGETRLDDRSSAPRRVPSRLPADHHRCHKQEERRQTHRRRLWECVATGTSAL
jgi:transposase